MLRVGQQVGSYQLTRILGKGSFAEVYLGVDSRLGTEVAIKLLHAHLVESDELEKFQQEARTIAKLDHPNIVRIRHFAVEEGTPYLVMDYAPNGSLRRRMITGQPGAPATIAPSLQQIAGALQHAHDQKLIHRDIKPENLLLGRHHEALLSDFGIAVALQQTRSHLTVYGFSGTPVYAAPEQFQNQVGPASDQYALAVVVYEWLTGEKPFHGDDLIAIGMAKVQQSPPPLRAKIPTLSPEIEQVVLTALAKEPKERFANVRAFANAFVQATQRAAPPPFVINVPAPELAPQPTLPVAPGPLPQATIPVVPVSYPQATLPATPAGNDILAAPTQISNPLSEAIHHAPMQISNPLPQTTPVVQQIRQIGASGPAAPTQIEPGQQTQTTEKPGGPPPGSVPEAKPPKSAADGARRRLLKSRRRIIALVALVVLPLLLGVLGYFSLVGVTVKDTYIITAVQGATSISKQQVNSRLVSIAVNQHSQAAPATGGPAPATQAHGILHLSNSFQNSVTLPQGLVLDTNQPVCSSTIQMVLDASVTLSAAATGTSVEAGVPAHVLQFGTIGNIPGQGNKGCFFHGAYSSESSWSAWNDHPFTGGRDAILQQSDLDRAANSLRAATSIPDPSDALRLLIHSNERLLGTPAPFCQPEVSSDHAVGDETGEALVSLSYLCTGYVYDSDGAAQIATRLLAARATRDLISFFKLNGQINATVTSATLTEPQQARIRLIVVAQGTWVLRL